MEHPLISLLDTPTLPVAFSSRKRHRNPKGCILANDDLLKNMTPETAAAELKKPRARAT